jgi:hypothetical protein
MAPALAFVAWPPIPSRYRRRSECRGWLHRASDVAAIGRPVCLPELGVSGTPGEHKSSANLVGRAIGTATPAQDLRFLLSRFHC